MTGDAEVFSALSESGIPGTKFCWPVGKAPATPWFTYELEDDGMFAADDENHAHIPVYRASLYEAEPDPLVESRFEDAVASLGPFTREEYWLESEKCQMTTYTFSYTGG